MLSPTGNFTTFWIFKVQFKAHFKEDLLPAVLSSVSLYTALPGSTDGALISVSRESSAAPCKHRATHKVALATSPSVTPAEGTARNPN